jgi:ParB-like chromosome segregation protein Spo0J
MLALEITKLTGHENARPPAALVRSLQDQGFLPAFPIVVAQEQNEIYPILDGRRRTAAAVKAGLETVLAVVTEPALSGVEGASAALTILAHSTRSENPVAELKAYQALMRAGLSEEQIARAGYASLNRVRKIAKLNNLIPEMAAQVEAGDIAPGVAFKIAGLAPEVQEALTQEEKITGAIVRAYRSSERREAVLTTPGVEAIFQSAPPATIAEVFAALSRETLQAVLVELPAEDRFVPWRRKIRQALALPTPACIPLQQFSRSSV